MTTEATRGRRAGRSTDAGAEAPSQERPVTTRQGRTRGRASEAPPAPAPTGPVLLRREPRVDLMPLEVKAARRDEAVAHRLLLALVVVVAVVVLAIGGSSALALQAGAQLSAEQARTAQLAQEQQKYAEVRQLQSRIALTQAGQQVGASTEVDWTAFLGEVRATTGGGLALTGISIDSASPLAAYEQSTVPLQGVRVATVTLDVKAADIGGVSAWLTRLASLPAVSDVAPGPVSQEESGYTASAIIHLGPDAFDHRFDEEGK